MSLGRLDGFDIISMPDKWEYPWFAALLDYTRNLIAFRRAHPGLPPPVPGRGRGRRTAVVHPRGRVDGRR